MSSILEEIVDDQMAFIEACGEALAEMGQDCIDNASALDEAFWSCIAALLKD